MSQCIKKIQSGRREKTLNILDFEDFSLLEVQYREKHGLILRLLRGKVTTGKFKALSKRT